MSKKSKVTKRKLSSMAERRGLPLIRYLTQFLERRSAHTPFTHPQVNRDKEKIRRRMRKDIWQKQRGYR